MFQRAGAAEWIFAENQSVNFAEFSEFNNFELIYYIDQLYDYISQTGLGISKRCKYYSKV